jgi:hypothetical protein
VVAGEEHLAGCVASAFATALLEEGQVCTTHLDAMNGSGWMAALGEVVIGADGKRCRVCVFAYPRLVGACPPIPAQHTHPTAQRALTAWLLRVHLVPCAWCACVRACVCR